MLSLTIDLTPRWVTLMPGVEVQVRPMHNGIWLAAKDSEAYSAAMERQDPNDLTFALGVEVAKRTIIDWRGVGDEQGAALAVTPDAITALMHMRDPFDVFFERVIGPWMGILDEKKGSAPLSDGTSAAAQNTAATVSAAVPPARARSTRRKASKA
ncbi:tail assembly chaperone [Nostoc phage Nsp-JY21]